MKTDREFATEVTQKLQAAGFTALFAGGCVRDDLLRKMPKDFDVATDAMPEQVRELFGFKRTLPIGEAFGVITVLGPRSVSPIEVATFRRDGGYSDGRRPDYRLNSLMLARMRCDVTSPLTGCSLILSPKK